MLCYCLENHPFLHFCCVFRLVNVPLIVFVVLTSSGNPLLFFLFLQIFTTILRTGSFI